jgi:hypothetical protein
MGQVQGRHEEEEHAAACAPWAASMGHHGKHAPVLHTIRATSVRTDRK